MVKQYKGHYPYKEEHITLNAPASIGVYYCGAVLSNGNLLPHYVGKGAGERGVWGRLLDHIRQERWYDITHFGFIECDSEQEALNLEGVEIKRFQPKYNIQRK